jgi:hypothetical protein
MVEKDVHLLGLVAPYDFAPADTLITAVLGRIREDGQGAYALRALRAAVLEAEAVRADVQLSERLASGGADFAPGADWQRIENAARKVVEHADKAFAVLAGGQS